MECKDDELDEYGNTADRLIHCCFPDCGCDGARNCMAEGEPNLASVTFNRERGAKREPEE